jgi:hypothetical protein
MPRPKSVATSSIFGEVIMEKENIVKNTFIELSKKYQYLFNSSIDITFNNLINEVGNKLFHENNKIQNDKNFINYFNWKKNNNVWINPIERRLKEFIENEK